MLPGVDAVDIWRFELPEGGPETMDAPTFGQMGSSWLVIRGPELESAITGSRIQLRSSVAGTDLPVTYAFSARTESTTSEVSDLSNVVVLTVQEGLPIASSLDLEATAEGIDVSWQLEPETASVAGFNVYRRPVSSRRYARPIAELDSEARSYLDRQARQGQRYFYLVRTVGGRSPLVEGAASAEREIDYRDLFAPEPPQRLVGLPEPGRVRLIWEPSASGDVAGYHVYRQALGSAYQQLTEEPVTGLEFLDQGLTPGLSYRYRATAVDLAGNEGEPTADVDVTVPE